VTSAGFALKVFMERSVEIDMKRATPCSDATPSGIVTFARQSFDGMARSRRVT
jgi:hypothetical protein